MAFGSVNVPGTSSKDLKNVKKIADDAVKAAGEAKTAATAAQTTANAAQTAASKAASDLAELNRQIEEGGGIGGGSGSSSVTAVFVAGTTPPSIPSCCGSTPRMGLVD